jgi:hypothetical protein
LSFNVPQSTPVSQQQGYLPSIGDQYIPRVLFTIEDVNRPIDHGVVVPFDLVQFGVPVGRTRRTILWEQTFPNPQTPLPLQQANHHKSTIVESLYRLPDRTKYWKVYIEHELRIITRDTSQFEYRVKRK